MRRYSLSLSLHTSYPSCWDRVQLERQFWILMNVFLTHPFQRLKYFCIKNTPEVRVMTKDAWSGTHESHTKRLTDGNRVLVVVVVMVSTVSVVSITSLSLPDGPFHDPKNSVMIPYRSFITHCTEFQNCFRHSFTALLEHHIQTRL